MPLNMNDLDYKNSTWTIYIYIDIYIATPNTNINNWLPLLSCVTNVMSRDVYAWRAKKQRPFQGLEIRKRVQKQND